MRELRVIIMATEHRTTIYVKRADGWNNLEINQKIKLFEF